MAGNHEQVTEIDRRITAAFRELDAARTRFATWPSGAVANACETAEATVNELLELRFALTRADAVPAGPPVPLPAA